MRYFIAMRTALNLRGLLIALVTLSASCAPVADHGSPPPPGTALRLISFDVNQAAGLEEFRRWPEGDVTAGPDQTLIVRARISTSNPCHTFEPELTQSGSEVVLRVRSRATAEGCIAMLGTWRMEAVIGVPSPGTYDLR